MTWPALPDPRRRHVPRAACRVVLGDRLQLPAWATRLLDLGATTLLVALAATAALTDAGGFVGWSRPCGVAVGVIAAWRRAPFAVVVVLAGGHRGRAPNARRVLRFVP